MGWTGPYGTWQDAPASVQAPSTPSTPSTTDFGKSVNNLLAACCTYWDQVRYKTYRVANPAVGGGSFAVDMEKIRDGYFWLVLHAAVHLELGSQTFVAFFICPDTDTDRNILPVQNVGGTNATPQGTGILLQGNNGPMSNTSSAYGQVESMPIACPVLPLIIPNKYFLRALTFNSNNTPAQGTFGVMRIMYLELPIGDPGPLLAF